MKVVRLWMVMWFGVWTANIVNVDAVATLCWMEYLAAWIHWATIRTNWMCAGHRAGVARLWVVSLVLLVWWMLRVDEQPRFWLFFLGSLVPACVPPVIAFSLHVCVCVRVRISMTGRHSMSRP